MALREVIEEVRQEIAAAGIGINEADAKAALITPILSELGWRGLQRIRSEYPVDQGRLRLDYALIGTGAKPVALIEAKAPREDLESHVAQVLNYAFHEGVDICVLTTGIIWWLYLPREKGTPAERRFSKLDLRSDDLAEVAAMFGSCLEHEALTSGAAEKSAKEMLAAQQLEQRVGNEIPRAWQRLLAEPNEMLIELVQEEVQDALDVRPSEKHVAAFFRHQSVADMSEDVAVAYGEPKTSSSSQERDNKSLRRRRSGSSRSLNRMSPDDDSLALTQMESIERNAARRARRPIYGFRLRGEIHRVSTWTDLWIELASRLYAEFGDEDGFLKRVRTSHNLQGPSRDYFSHSPQGMIRPYKIKNSEIWLECNFSSDSIATRCFELTQAFGRDKNDFEVLDKPPV